LFWHVYDIHHAKWIKLFVWFLGSYVFYNTNCILVKSCIFVAVLSTPRFLWHYHKKHSFISLIVARMNFNIFIRRVYHLNGNGKLKQTSTVFVHFSFGWWLIGSFTIIRLCLYYIFCLYGSTIYKNTIHQ